MKTINQLASELELEPEDCIPYGHYTGKLDVKRILKRLRNKSNGKYINVTAITPTPKGEGKTTVTIGLVQALHQINKNAIGAIRQPSSGPTFNIKGSGAGGGQAICLPHDQISLGLTGDIDAITNAHNLAMVALTSRLQHESNYSDDVLESKNLIRLNIDPDNVAIHWAIDLCAQALRNIVIGMGDKHDGIMMKSGFQISVSSELMAILSLCTSLKDLRERVANMIVAYSKDGQAITTRALEVDGAMTAILAKTLLPNLIQTIEGQSMLMHSGPFANVALGQSSILADYLGLKLADYLVTESGFGADIGFEKFWNIKCRISGLKPDCVVLVATIRALKMHGGGPRICPGQQLSEEYSRPNNILLEKGLENLWAHIDIIQQSGINPIVCINRFDQDSSSETEAIIKALKEKNLQGVVSRHYEQGGKGAIELADAVVQASNTASEFKFLYPEELDVEDKIIKIATRIYGAKEVSFSPNAKEKIKKINSSEKLKKLHVCMAKTPLSLSDNQDKKGRPLGWRLFIREIKIFQGAGLIVPITGDLKLLPGTSSNPAFRQIDVDTESGEIKGLF